MKFSVLISLYIKEQPTFLQQCLESLLNQSLQASEIIIILDGSVTLELSTILDNYKTKLPIIIIPLVENIGLGKALNIGLQHCTYEWVLRMDTDDICHQDRFKKQISYIKQHPEIDIFSTAVIEFDEIIPIPNSDSNKIKQVPLTHNEIIKFAQFRSPFNHMSIAYKKSIIQKIGGYQHHLWMEDYNLWLRVLAAGYKAANLSDCLVYARAGYSMLTRRRGWGYVKSEWKLFQLKKNLHFQNIIVAFIIFLIRSIPRLLPISAVQLVYKYLRKN